MGWLLVSEVVGRANVNKKMPNNSTDTKEKMPNNTSDSVITTEKVRLGLDKLAKKYEQVNFASETARKMMAEDLTIEIKKEKMPNNNMDLVNNLLDDILNAAAQDDEHLKEYWLTSGQGEKTIGESFVVYHLKVLKKLLNE
tara:strand:- start:3944 stop:4366 length:423 start_codon:yes stop_codon:yes gene_type:complete